MAKEVNRMTLEELQATVKIMADTAREAATVQGHLSTAMKATCDNVDTLLKWLVRVNERLNALEKSMRETDHDA